MKKTCAICLLIVISMSAFSQAFKASYTYDANGNRTLATIIWLSTSLKNDEVGQENTNAFSEDNYIGNSSQGNSVFNAEKPLRDTINGNKFAIYPNPTHGKLSILIEGKEIINPKGDIAVYNINGVLILNQSIISSCINIDLSDQPSGTYMLTIKFDSYSKQYAIIKN